MTIRSETLARFDSGQYQQPTPDEVRELLALADWKGSKAAGVAGVDGRTVRRWTADPDQSGAREIPYAAWRLMLIEARMVRED